MKDRVPKYPGRVYVTPENEGAPYYATIERADEPVEAGTPLNKATLLSDETAELYEKPTDTAVPDDNLLAATADLSCATAVSLKYGRTNGEIDEGLKQYNKAIAAFRDYEREKLAEQV